MPTKQLSISEFRDHFADQMAAVESGDTIVELTRDGQIVALISPAPKARGTSGTLADWVGTGAGFTLAPGCNLDDPAFSPEDWEEFPESQG